MGIKFFQMVFGLSILCFAASANADTHSAKMVYHCGKITKITWFESMFFSGTMLKYKFDESISGELVSSWSVNKDHTVSKPAKILEITDQKEIESDIERYLQRIHSRSQWKKVETREEYDTNRILGEERIDQGYAYRCVSRNVHTDSSSGEVIQNKDIETVTWVSSPNAFAKSQFSKFLNHVFWESSLIP